MKEIILANIGTGIPDCLHMEIMRSIDKANHELDAKLNDLRHMLNDQLIELKYGKGYKAAFMDSILLQASNL